MEANLLYLRKNLNTFQWHLVGTIPLSSPNVPTTALDITRLTFVQGSEGILELLAVLLSDNGLFKGWYVHGLILFDVETWRLAFRRELKLTRMQLRDYEWQ